MRNADFLFTTGITQQQTQKEIAELKQAARAQGRNLDVMTLPSLLIPSALNATRCLSWWLRSSPVYRGSVSVSDHPGTIADQVRRPPRVSGNQQHRPMCGVRQNAGIDRRCLWASPRQLSQWPDTHHGWRSAGFLLRPCWSRMDELCSSARSPRPNSDLLRKQLNSTCRARP